MEETGRKEGRKEKEGRVYEWMEEIGRKEEGRKRKDGGR